MSTTNSISATEACYICDKEQLSERRTIFDKALCEQCAEAYYCGVYEFQVDNSR